MADDKTVIADNVSLTVLTPGTGQQPCLVQYSGQGLGRRFILDESEMVVGRAPDMPIHINEPSVSRKHARFFLRGEKVELEDLGSANGTFVNEAKVTRTELQSGDMIRFGTAILKFLESGNLEGAIADEIYRKATIDPTTSIFNKQYLMDEIESKFKIARNFSRPLSIIYFDLDHFREVNNNHGHNCGDSMLRDVAQLCRGAIRKNDIIARFGGEEFVIILPDTDAATATELAERVRQAVEATSFTFEDKTLRQTISLGVSELDEAMRTTKDLLESADQKLYQSKRSGRNRVTA